MTHDLRGKVVPESEVAADLGFANVHELRRFQTDIGHKNLELEYALKGAIGERDNFQAIGLRMQRVLELVAESIDRGEPISAELRLAIGVVTGKEADWGGKVEDWLYGRKGE